MKQKNQDRKPRAKAVNYKAVRLQKKLFRNETSSESETDEYKIEE